MEELLDMEERAVSIMAEITMGWMRAHERRRSRRRRINFNAPFWTLLKVIAGTAVVWAMAVIAGGLAP